MTLKVGYLRKNYRSGFLEVILHLERGGVKVEPLTILVGEHATQRVIDGTQEYASLMILENPERTR